MVDTVLHYGDLLYLETQAHFHLRDTPCLRLPPLCDLVLASVEACESYPHTRRTPSPDGKLSS